MATAQPPRCHNGRSNPTLKWPSRNHRVAIMADQTPRAGRALATAWPNGHIHVMSWPRTAMQLPRRGRALANR
eukprot:9869975-Lingulodinium_polyedra.AAC.1